MLKIKICGVTNVADAVAAGEEGADYLGLIFAPSPRRIDTKTAHDILWNLPRGVEAVGVFRNQPLAEVKEILNSTGLRIAQLHGEESPDYCRQAGIPVIKAFDTFSPAALERLKTFDAFAFLLDVPKGGGARPQIDPEWALLAKRHGRVILAGRLTPASVGELVIRVRPYGVDCCAGTEKSPGLKDRSKIHDFIRAAREAHQETTRIKVKTR